MTALVLDEGAFIGWERGDVAVRAHLESARRLGISPMTVSPVIAQVWRNGSRQVLLARLVKSVEVRAPTLFDAQRAGELCGETRTVDVVDALLVAASPNTATVLTSDSEDIADLKRAAKRKFSIVTV